MGKTLLITGGTGSFGNAVAKQFLKTKNIMKLEFLVEMKASKKRCDLNLKIVSFHFIWEM